MSDKFSVWKFLIEGGLNSEEPEMEDPEQQMQQGQPPEATPEQQNQTQQKSADPQATAFRGLQGQMISGMTYTPNGTNGGTLKIQVKNSYTPFTVSWVNQRVTVTDLQGKTVMLSDDETQ